MSSVNEPPTVIMIPLVIDCDTPIGHVFTAVLPQVAAATSRIGGSQ